MSFADLGGVGVGRGEHQFAEDVLLTRDGVVTVVRVFGVVGDDAGVIRNDAVVDVAGDGGVNLPGAAEGRPGGLKV